MRNVTRTAFLAALITACIPTAAQAADWPNRATFAEGAVSDLELAAQRGGFAGTPAGLTAGSFARLVDVEARDASRMMGTINRISMDIWWGSTGAEMIATNVRTAQQ